MKAISVQQPFAFFIATGQKSIEVRSWKTDYRGDLLVCSSAKGAFNKEEMEEFEAEWGCTFLYGHALCIVRLADVRPMQEGDEEASGMETIDPEAYAWVLEDARLVLPFPVKGKQGLFEVKDDLIEPAPFQFDETVAVKPGTFSEEFGIDLSGWRGRVSGITPTEDGEDLVTVVWDSESLKALPISVIEMCEREGFDWTTLDFSFDELEPAGPRDTWDDVREAIAKIIDDHPELFPVEDD